MKKIANNKIDLRDAFLIPVFLFLILTISDFTYSAVYLSGNYTNVMELNPLVQNDQGYFDVSKGIILLLIKLLGVIGLTYYYYSKYDKPLVFSNLDVKSFWSKYRNYLTTFWSIYSLNFIGLCALVWNIFSLNTYWLNETYYEVYSTMIIIGAFFGTYLSCSFAMRYIKLEIRAKNKFIYQFMLLPYRIKLLKGIQY